MTFLSDAIESTGSGLFALLSHDFEEMFGQIGQIGCTIVLKKLSNTNLVSSRHINSGKRLTFG